MKRTRATIIGLLAAVVLIAAACGDDTNKSSSGSNDNGGSSGPVKAAWIYVGPINDGGWTQAHDAGRKYVESKLGNKVKTTYKENVPEGPETAQVVEDLIKDGNKIIFATSFGFGDAVKEAAAKHPDVKFEFATGPESDITKNLGVYYGTGEDANYLAGMAAGAATKSGTIGFVAPFPIPEVIRHIDAYTLGVQAMNPSAKVKVVWINNWFAPDKERQAAESMIADGADVIANGGDSPAPGEAAKAKNIPWTGYDSDQSKNFPDIWLTAAVYDWGPYYLKQVQDVIDGTWKAGSYYGNLGDGFADIAPFGKLVSADTRAAIEAKKSELASKPQSEFTGPIKDQDGKVKVPAGEQISPADLQTIDWFVEGVVGNPKG
jgi:basic membrane protein A